MLRRLIILLLIVGCDNSTESNKHGCLDSQACNYDADATIDNNSCLYEVDCAGVCGGDKLLDNCDVCDGDDTSCYGGCTDTNACNYDVTADIDDSSCWFASEGCACENGQGAVVDYLGVCDTDNNNNPPDDDLDGICNVGVIGGCINELACNYDSSAAHNNGTCDYNC